MTGSTKLLNLPMLALGAASLSMQPLPLEAAPLSPVTDTVKTVTDTAGRTVSGTAQTAGKTVSGAGKTIATTIENPGLPAPQPEGTPAGGLGRPIVEPVGTLIAPDPAPAASSSGNPSGTTSGASDVTQPYDAYRTSIPDVLPRGTLARIYFKPGETTLDGAAKNRIIGFVQNFQQRIGNVDIKGYADRASGGDARASDIAMARALAVQEALLAQGISAGRLRASAMGNIGKGDAPEDRVDIRFDGY